MRKKIRSLLLSLKIMQPYLLKQISEEEGCAESQSMEQNSKKYEIGKQFWKKQRLPGKYEKRYKLWKIESRSSNDEQPSDFINLIRKRRPFRVVGSLFRIWIYISGFALVTGADVVGRCCGWIFMSQNILYHFDISGQII